MTALPHQFDPAAEPASAVPHRPRRRRRPVAQVGQLNLTSMIDVIFQLLIYFVVTASFMVDEGVLTAKLPQGQAGPAAADLLPPEQILIGLTPGTTDDTLVQIERGPAGSAVAYDSFEALAGDLQRLRYDPSAGQAGGIYAPDNPVLIEPAPGVRWQHVVNAFNAAVAARYTNVRFAPPADTDPNPNPPTNPAVLP